MTVPVVELTGVSASHGVTVDVPVDLRIEPGDRVWIDGRSGVGKTSLLYVIGALTMPRRGQVRILGKDVDREAVARRLRRSEISFVLQDAALVEHWSVAQNLRAAVGPRRLDRVRALLEEWDVPCGQEAPRSLSGGERQRLSVCCALARDSRLVVADEPSSSLDRANRELVMAAFGSLPREAAVVVSSHDPEWGVWATRRLTLGDAA